MEILQKSALTAQSYQIQSAQLVNGNLLLEWDDGQKSCFPVAKRLSISRCWMGRFN